MLLSAVLLSLLASVHALAPAALVRRPVPATMHARSGAPAPVTVLAMADAARDDIPGNAQVSTQPISLALRARTERQRRARPVEHASWRKFLRMLPECASGLPCFARTPLFFLGRARRPACCAAHSTW